MALVHEKYAKNGKIINIYEQRDNKSSFVCTARVMSPHFYDPKGVRLRS